MSESRQAMYVKRDIDGRSCDRCCSGKELNCKHYESVFVALGIEYVVFMHHIVICGLPGSTIFFNI